MVHLVVVEPDLYLYTLPALFWAYSSYRHTKQISICSVDSSLGKNCSEQYSELAKVDDVDSSAGLNAARKLIASLYELVKFYM
jgi:hypothetical protein